MDPLALEQMRKKMMLEKFQRDHPGFDFTGAQFDGAVPDDPKNFMKVSPVHVSRLSSPLRCLGVLG